MSDPLIVLPWNIRVVGTDKRRFLKPISFDYTHHIDQFTVTVGLFKIGIAAEVIA